MNIAVFQDELAALKNLIGRRKKARPNCTIIYGSKKMFVTLLLGSRLFPHEIWAANNHGKKCRRERSRNEATIGEQFFAKRQTKIGEKSMEYGKVSKEVNSVFVTRDRAEIFIVFRDYCIIISSKWTISLALVDSNFFEHRFLTVPVPSRVKTDNSRRLFSNIFLKLIRGSIAKNIHRVKIVSLCRTALWRQS